MPSRSSSRSAKGIDKLDFDDNRRPPSTTDGSESGRLLRDDESLLSDVVHGVVERDRRKMRRQVTKYLSFVSAILSCLCAGSITAYSLYGPLFQSRLNYTQGQVNAVSTAAELAMYLPVPIFGYLCDRLSPRPLSLFAGIFFGLGYLLAALAYHHGSVKEGGFPPAIMVISFIGVGMGTSCMYLSAVTTCAKNFGRGKHKGLALAMPIAAFGLSGMWQSQVGSQLLYERSGERRGEVDVYRYFIFLAILLFAVGVIGAFALNVVNEEELIDEAVSELERSGLLEDSPFFHRSVIHDSSNGYGAIDSSETISNSAESDEADAIRKSRSGSEDARRKTWLLDNETRVFLLDHTMWFLAAGFFAVTGPGEAFINNLGTIINTLYPPPSAGPPSSNSPATHVSIVALTSTLARLLTGTLTDLLAPVAPSPLVLQHPGKRFTCSRLVFLLGSTLLFSLGQLLLASGLVQTYPLLFPLVSALVGLGYGAVFSLTPIIVSVVWGVQNFGTNWGIVVVVPAAGAAVWGAIYAAVYDRAAGSKGESGAERLCYGVWCYAPTFWGMTAFSWIAIALWIMMPTTTVSFTRRAVSPVHFESLEPDPDDVLCPGSDAEEAPEQRSNRTRRVEEAAQEYLRGRSLYIASARLRGPFPDHWRNPYAIKKRRAEILTHGSQNASQPWQNPPWQSQDVAPQIQDSAVQTGGTEPQVEEDASLRPHRKKCARRTRHTPDSRRPTIGEETRATQDSFVTATSEPSNEARSIKAGKASSSEARGWLKTDGLYTEQEFRKGPSSPSPTPASRPRRLSPERLEAMTKRRDLNKRSTASEIEDRTKLPDSTNVPSPVSKPDAPAGSLEAAARDEKQPRYAIPPSTNLPGFEYRYVPPNAPRSPNGKSFKSELEAVKKRARVEEKKRLSFTASGNVKKRPSHTSSRESQPTKPHQVKLPPRIPQSGMTDESRTADEKYDSRPKIPAGEGSVSDEMGALPEAQIVQQVGLSNDRSVPSAELLETEKQSLKFRSTDEGDLYHGLSTQAAMLQAQRSLQNDSDSPAVLQGSHRRDGHHVTTDYGRPMIRRETDHQPAGAPGRELVIPVANDDEPMSTQAMFDAVSPFVLTTVKKRAPDERQFDLVGSAGSSPPQSPTVHDFRVTSLSMSTTPSESPCPANNERPIPLSALSKPKSTITSFSIAPNGTMTEVMQYDGQQQQHYDMGDSDLDAALEEAGSFLGDWSVEKEAKQFERATAGSKNSTA
ncbi:MAG: hypothetical protein LQ343_003816 [Gyalolechia ehrenbergii]|nr:MAG: hypothetical protein LQ343_003816 [Gyalolechia ehrenbergii]